MLALITLVLALNIPLSGTGAIKQNLLTIINKDSLAEATQFLAQSGPLKTMKVVLTGYSSTFDQTDGTPFITASNSCVRDGIVAANFLAFGTKIQIPEIFGDKVFIVEDRMARKHSDKIDIWFPEKQLAKNFGVQEAEVVILE